MFARWRKARFLPNKNSGRSWHHPRRSPLGVLRRNTGGKRTTLFLMDFGKMECQVEEDTLGRKLGDNHRKFGGMMDEWMK